MLTDHLPRVNLAHLPTPLEPLPCLTARLDGPELWIKRDDQTGLAMGGHKARKLEFLLADALERGADTLVTCGSAQSNQACQTAAAAARVGFDCTLVLQGEAPPCADGSLLLDRLFGADLHWTGRQTLDETMAQVAEGLRAAGHRPYIVPYGASNPVGISGDVAAIEELLLQCEQACVYFDRIVLASCSGGTLTGLVVGARAVGYEGSITGISVHLQANALRRILTDLASATAEHLKVGFAIAPEDFVVYDDYLGGGYGAVGDMESEAIRVVASTEGVLLDPIYTSRAFGGLMDLIRTGGVRSDERVLFWHTGGTPALFAYADQLSPAESG